MGNEIVPAAGGDLPVPRMTDDHRARAGHEPAGPLRVGILLGRRRAPAWVAALVEALGAEPGVEVCRVGTAPVGGRRRGGPAAGLRSGYRRVDARLFGRTGDPTLPVDVGRFVDALPPAQVADVDVVLALAGARVDERLGAPGRRPVTLRLRHESIAGAPDPGDLAAAPDVADTLAGTACMATAVVADADGTERVVARVVSATDALSARRGGRNHWPKVVMRPIAVLRALRRDGELAGLPESGLPPIEPRPAATTVPATLAGFARIGAGYARRLADRTLAPERWIVAIHDAGVPRGADAAADPSADPLAAAIADPHAGGYDVLMPPPDREWADPFPVETDDGVVVFVEEYVRSRGRGHLAVVSLDAHRRASPATPVLELDHHCSYPFVFRWDGAWYLLPEQAAAGTLELYRATDFPTGWVHDRTVLDRPAADATIAEIDGTWWLFTALPGEGGTTPDELHLFRAAGPLGPWEPHPANPVVTDVRTARPAGRLFRVGDAWYRPAQNGGPTYGYSIVVLRIEQLDGSGYRERLVHEIRPGWGPGVSATHTLNRAGAITAIDARIREPRVSLGRRPGTGARRA